MPVGLFSEEEVLSFWISLLNPVRAVGNISVSMRCLLVSGTVSVDVDSLVMGLPFVLSSSPVSDLIDVHV
jgi:hypothetical protein